MVLGIMEVNATLYKTLQQNNVEQQKFNQVFPSNMDFSDLMICKNDDEVISTNIYDELKELSHDKAEEKTVELQAVKSNPEKRRLHEFIMDLLIEQKEDCIRWCNKDDGEFEITNSSKIAMLWGKLKNNPTMTYEKLARALRHYYKLDILTNYKQKGKLRYKFSQRFLNGNFKKPQKIVVKDRK